MCVDVKYLIYIIYLPHIKQYLHVLYIIFSHHKMMILWDFITVLLLFVPHLSFSFIFLSQSPLHLFLVPSTYPYSTVTYSSSRPQLWSLYTFLISALSLDYILTFKDLELGTADKREHVPFVFLSLGYLSQYNFFLGLPIYLQISWFIFLITEQYSIVSICHIFITHNYCRAFKLFPFSVSCHRGSMNIDEQVCLVGCQVLWICAKECYKRPLFGLFLVFRIVTLISRVAATVLICISSD